MEHERNIVGSWRRLVLAAAVAGVVSVAGFAVTRSTANADTAVRSRPSRLVVASSPVGEPRIVAANKRVVLAFIQDVLNAHHGDHAAGYLTPDMQWHGGTVGTVAGRDNVAGLLSAVVTSLPDLHAAVQDIFGQGNEVVVRLIVTGTQRGPLLGIPATGRPIRWDAVDVYRLKGGKVSQEWAAEDFTAVLYYTGTYKAPWIP